MNREVIVNLLGGLRIWRLALPNKIQQKNKRRLVNAVRKADVETRLVPSST